AGLLPDLRRMEHGHYDLLPADCIHLLSDDRVDLVEDRESEGQVDVNAGGELPDQAGSHHELVADRFGIRGIVPQRRDDGSRPAHAGACYFAPGTLFAPGTPGS